MNGYLADTFNLIVTGILIILNAFFVAAEFALVKVNKSKIKAMEKDGNPFASVALWLYKRQNMALSACQMGITMASLALGWIGEPALAHLMKPLLISLGITSEVVLHGVAFTVAFTLITSLHIVIGEQFPKIYAIRKPVSVVGWSAFPLKFFYVIFYPFMWVLDRVTSYMLNAVGIETAGEHETALTEEEIRASLSIAYHSGDLTKHEHELLDAAFKFDDRLTRQIMLPRSEVDFFDYTLNFRENIDLAKRTKHTRFPLCEGSLDQIKGVIHIKDLIGLNEQEKPDLLELVRPGIFVPDTLPIHELLQEFRRSKQHFAFVEDEYGTMVGIVTLENVIEELIGNVEDEFDEDLAPIQKESSGKYLVDGNLSIEILNERLGTDLESEDADSLSGLLTEQAGMHLSKNQKVRLNDGTVAEIVQLKHWRVTKARLHIISDINIDD